MHWTNQPQTLTVPWWVWQGLNLRPPPCEGQGPTPNWRFPWVFCRTRCQSVFVSFRACSSRSAQMNQGELSMSPTSVYVIACGDHIKIGVSVKPENRLRIMSTGSLKSPTWYHRVSSPLGR